MKHFIPVCAMCASIILSTIACTGSSQPVVQNLQDDILVQDSSYSPDPGSDTKEPLQDTFITDLPETDSPNDQKEAYLAIMSMSDINDAVEVSVDHDDALESISISEEDYNCKLNIKDGDENYFYEVEGQFSSLYLSDLATDQMFLFLTVDYASSDYITVCLTYQDGSFLNVPIRSNTNEYANDCYYGEVKEIKTDGTITFGLIKDVLGTWGFERSYVLQNGTIEPLDPYFTYPYSDYYLTTACEIPAVKMEGTDKTEFLLPAGTNLYPLYIEEDNTFYFKTEDGTEVCLYPKWNDAVWTINGLDEYTCFTELMYAG